LRYCADDRDGNSAAAAAAAAAQRSQILEESANEDAHRTLLLHVFQKGEAGERSAGERHERALHDATAIPQLIASRRRGKIAWAVARGGLARAHNATSPVCTILLSVGNLHWLRCVPRTSSIITFSSRVPRCVSDIIYIC